MSAKTLALYPIISIKKRIHLLNRLSSPSYLLRLFQISFDIHWPTKKFKNFIFDTLCNISQWKLPYWILICRYLYIILKSDVPSFKGNSFFSLFIFAIIRVKFCAWCSLVHLFRYLLGSWMVFNLCLPNFSSFPVTYYKFVVMWAFLPLLIFEIDVSVVSNSNLDYLHPSLQCFTSCVSRKLNERWRSDPDYYWWQPLNVGI